MSHKHVHAYLMEEDERRARAGWGAYGDAPADPVVVDLFEIARSVAEADREANRVRPPEWGPEVEYRAKNAAAASAATSSFAAADPADAA